MARPIILIDIGSRLTLIGVLPSVTKFAAYNARLVATGGEAPYTYTTADALPAGMLLDRSTGVLSASSVTEAGVCPVTIRATDITGAYVDRVYVITVTAEPLVISGDAGNGTVGTAYSYAYAATGGHPPYTWSIATGALPAGLALNASTGEIAGTPTAGGAAAWTVRLTDAGLDTYDLADTATMAAAPLTLSGAYAAATVGTPYSSDLTIAGGDGTYSNPRVTVGALPAGLALSIVGDKLRLSGTPTAEGTSNFTVAAESGDGQTATSAQSVAVASGVTVRGVIAQWNMDDATGSTTVADSSGNMRDAALLGGYTLQQPSILPGGGGKSVLLSHATSGRIQIPSGFMASFSRPFSILSFVRLTAIGRTQQILASAPGGVNFYVGTDGKLVVGTAGVANLAIDSRVLSAATNYLLAVTASATGDVYLYVNKAASAKFAGVVDSTVTGSDLAQLGNWYYSGTNYQYSLDGNMQRVILCNVELSAAEIATYYDAL